MQKTTDSWTIHATQMCVSQTGINVDLNADLEIGMLAMSKRITDLGHKFGTTLERHLFTFMRHSGMEPTNNVAERIWWS